MLGFTLSQDWDGNSQLWQKPSLNEAALAFWTGASHMAAAINIGASQYRDLDLTNRYFVSGRERDPVFLSCALGVIAAWLILLLVLTAMLFRPAFASNMDNRTAARMCAERPELLNDVGAGRLGDNPKLRERFRVASVTGAIASFLSDDEDKESARHSPKLPTLSKTA
jgi:hypothetical protein